jgi:cell division protein FtsQ
MTQARPNRRKAPKRALPELPKLPRLPINWRLLAMLGVACGVLAVAYSSGRELLQFPLQTLDLEGSFQHVSKLELEAAVRPMRNQNLLTLDFAEMRDRIKAIDWVDTVQLKRVWPDTVRIRVTEHVAAARWGESGLLNTRGELFAEDTEQEYPRLPKLDGPDGSLERVAERYLEISARLSGTGLNLAAVEMDDRGSFRIEFGGALVVQIGREDIDLRIDRFFTIALPELVGKLKRADYVDMRYSNGFAVGWHESEPEPARLARVDSHG